MEVVYSQRHGVTHLNLADRWCGGGSDVSLAPEGHVQAQEAAEKAVAEGLEFDIIISSPLLRARQTAGHMAAATGYPIADIAVNSLFRERNFGRLEGQTQPPALMASYRRDETSVDGYGGETFAQLQSRADQAVEYLKGLPYRRGLIVGHGTFGRAFYRSVHNLSSDIWGPNLSNAEIKEYDLTKPAVSIADKDSITFDKRLCTSIYLFHLSVRQWQVDTGNHKFSNFYESSEDLPHITDYYIGPGGNFYLARDDKTGDITGIVGLRNDGEGHGTLKRLAVNPNYHRQKIGTRMVGELIAWARKNGFKTIFLTTGETENAKPIYEECGFKVVGRVSRNNDYEMELTLS